MAYTQVTVASYNAAPPTDDGGTDAINRVTWAGIKTKLGDPLKTAIESIDDNVGSAVDATDASIVALEASIAGLDTDLDSQEGVMTAPAGTETFFVQTTPPTGWTKITTHNNKAIRLVSGSVSTGGTTAFTSVLASRTITSSLMPAHTHGISHAGGSISLDRTSWVNSIDVDTGGGFDAGSAVNGCTTVNTDEASLSGTISFSGTTGSAGSGTAMDFAVQYVDVVLASKD